MKLIKTYRGNPTQASWVNQSAKKNPIGHEPNPGLCRINRCESNVIAHLIAYYLPKVTGNLMGRHDSRNSAGLNDPNLSIRKMIPEKKGDHRCLSTPRWSRDYHNRVPMNGMMKMFCKLNDRECGSCRVDRHTQTRVRSQSAVQSPSPEKPAT
jgi:hypothetical protein